MSRRRRRARRWIVLEPRDADRRPHDHGLRTKRCKIIKASNDAMSASLNTGAARLSEWDAQISKVRASGDLPTIMQELKDGSSTVKQLAEQFDISAEAITRYTNRTKESSAILEKWRANEQAGIEKMRKAQEELNQAGDGWRNTLHDDRAGDGGGGDAIPRDGRLANRARDEVRADDVSSRGARQGAQRTDLRRSPQRSPRSARSISLWPGWRRRSERPGENMMFFDQQLIASIATVEAEPCRRSRSSRRRFAA